MKSFLIALSFVTSLSAADWNQWRGPTRDGKAASEAWPASLKEDKLKQSWKVDLGPSYSGPIVSSNLVFTTETEEKKTEIVRALDRRTGREVWKQSWPGAMSMPFFAKANGDRILALDQRGSLYLFKANPAKFDLIDQRKISDKETWAHLAVAGDEIYIRQLNALVAWSWSD